MVFFSGSRILGSRISNFTYNVQPTIVQRFLVLLTSAQRTTCFLVYRAPVGSRSTVHVFYCLWYFSRFLGLSSPWPFLSFRIWFLPWGRYLQSRGKVWICFKICLLLLNPKPYTLYPITWFLSDEVANPSAARISCCSSSSKSDCFPIAYQGFYVFL
jgi:hypothetical protein